MKNPNKIQKIKEIYEKISTPQERILDILETLDPKQLQGKDGHTPTKEELTSIIKPLIPKPLKPKDGKNPSQKELLEMIREMIPILIPKVKPFEITPEQIRDKLIMLKGKERLSVLSLKDLEWLKTKEGMQWSSAGFSVYHDTTLTGDGSFGNPLSVVGGGSLSIIAMTGVVNGSNASFTCFKSPSLVCSDGALYQKKDNNGNTQWTVSGSAPNFTVTMVIPPQSAIFGTS